MSNLSEIKFDETELMSSSSQPSPSEPQKSKTNPGKGGQDRDLRWSRETSLSYISNSEVEEIETKRRKKKKKKKKSKRKSGNDDSEGSFSSDLSESSNSGKDENSDNNKLKVSLSGSSSRSTSKSSNQGAEQPTEQNEGEDSDASAGSLEMTIKLPKHARRSVKLNEYFKNTGNQSKIDLDLKLQNVIEILKDIEKQKSDESTRALERKESFYSLADTDTSAYNTEGEMRKFNPQNTVKLSTGIPETVEECLRLVKFQPENKELMGLCFEMFLIHRNFCKSLLQESYLYSKRFCEGAYEAYTVDQVNSEVKQLLQIGEDFVHMTHKVETIFKSDDFISSFLEIENDFFSDIAKRMTSYLKKYCTDDVRSGEPNQVFSQKLWNCLNQTCLICDQMHDKGQKIAFDVSIDIRYLLNEVDEKLRIDQNTRYLQQLSILFGKSSPVKATNNKIIGEISVVTMEQFKLENDGKEKNLKIKEKFKKFNCFLLKDYIIFTKTLHDEDKLFNYFELDRVSCELVYYHKKKEMKEKFMDDRMSQYKDEMLCDSQIFLVIPTKTSRGINELQFKFKFKIQESFTTSLRALKNNKFANDLVMRSAKKFESAFKTTKAEYPNQDSSKLILPTFKFLT